ncbi:MAG: rod-binding protein [Leptospiraceae bacterium]|nr:rod-binding protein [Leptospiraceae bacterium]
MKIDGIQDYMNRLSIGESGLEKMKSMSKETENLKNSEFLNELQKNSVNEFSGKVSSSDIKYPNNIKEEISKDPYRKKLFNASVEFESMFVKIMLNQMKKSINKQGFIHGGYAEEVFEDMLYDEYSKDISKNSSLGLAEQMYQSLSVSLPPVVDKKI